MLSDGGLDASASDIFTEHVSYKTNKNIVLREFNFPACLCLHDHTQKYPNSGDIDTHYRKTSNISRTLVDNRIVDNSDVTGASPVGAAPTASSFST